MSYVADAKTIFPYLNESSTASAQSSLDKSASTTFSAPFSSKISFNFSHTFNVFPCIEAHAM